MRCMDTIPPTPAHRLRAYVDGHSADYREVMEAIWQGRLPDLSTIRIVVEHRPYLSEGGQPRHPELRGYRPVSSESDPTRGASWD